jgi:phytoene dehydrogenase-like protein
MRMKNSDETFDAVIIGSGPNGLAAAAALAREGHSVAVLEAADSIGGGTRTAELTLPGFHHDFCSGAHPMGILSPFFRELPLDKYGLEWVQGGASVAHPLDDRPAVMLMPWGLSAFRNTRSCSRGSARWRCGRRRLSPNAPSKRTPQKHCSPDARRIRFFLCRTR